MTEHEDTVLMCGAARPGVAVIPGSVRDFCLGCDRPIWVAPTGQQLKANGALLYCVPCGMRRMGAEGERVAMMTPEQLVELRQAIGGGASRPSAE